MTLSVPSSRPGCPHAADTLLGLGASLGDRFGNLQLAVSALADCGVIIEEISGIYESPHLGLNAGDDLRYPAHLNLVLRGNTTLSPDALLDEIHRIEAKLGRDRQVRWGPRTIDIDILTYDGIRVADDRLTLPHPGISARLFVARPLLDVMPSFQLSDGSFLRDRIDCEPLSSQRIWRTEYLLEPPGQQNHLQPCPARNP